MTQWIEQSLPGVYLLQPFVQNDHRGSFVKTFHAPQALTSGLTLNLREEFYSVSHRNVLRGMHFQLPPHDHQKLVYCIAGEITDVLLDLRKASSSYGQSMSLTLAAENKHVIWIPRGIAHGFISRSDNSCVVYKTDAEYEHSADTGIRFDSFGYDWKCETSIVSERDRGFSSLSDFKSPF